MEYETQVFFIIICVTAFILFQVCVVAFIFKVIKSIFNAIGRTISHQFFKSNVASKSDYLERLRERYKDRTDLTKEELNLLKGKNIYTDISKEELQMFNTTNREALKDYFYDLFYKFEVAYNSLDYNMMRMLSTKQLFQNYYTGISLDLKVGEKKVINNIERKKVILYEVDSTVARQTASVMIEVSYVTYTLDKNGYIISGSREEPVVEKFEVTFRKALGNALLKDNVSKCPNCGATIEGSKCEYCRSELVNTEFKISNIKKIVD